MRTEIKRLYQKLKASIVYVTHDQIEAMTLATKIVVLKDGLIQEIGTPSEIYNFPANLFMADFSQHCDIISSLYSLMMI